jgi:hypothetical protein
MKINLFKSKVVLLTCVFFLGLNWAGPQSKNGSEKIVGDWSMEVDAGGEYYYLSFTIQEENGSLSGKISEEAGTFIDVKMEKIEFDGQKFRFEMTIPTPPDGAENLVKGDFELLEEKMEGTLTIEEFGMTAFATCTRKK